MFLTYLGEYLWIYKTIRTQGIASSSNSFQHGYSKELMMSSWHHYVPSVQNFPVPKSKNKLASFITTIA